LRRVVFEYTTRCNLACGHCFMGRIGLREKQLGEYRALVDTNLFGEARRSASDHRARRRALAIIRHLQMRQ